MYNQHKYLYNVYNNLIRHYFQRIFYLLYFNIKKIKIKTKKIINKRINKFSGKNFILFLFIFISFYYYILLLNILIIKHFHFILFK